MTRASCLGAILAVALAGAARAEEYDLRDFRLGQTVASLPGDEYVHFLCADAPDVALDGWADYTRCPVDAGGRRAVGFQYDVNPRALLNDNASGTKLGGHPVVIALLIDGQGALDAIRVETDPKARAFMRKKGYLMALQIKARYGADGWTCRDGQPSAQAEPVGGIFVDQHCEKQANGRRYVLDSGLYLKPDAALKDDTNFTRLLIERAG